MSGRVLLKDWADWKRCCAVEASPPEARARLSQYLDRITRKFMESYSIRPEYYVSGSEQPEKQAVAIFDGWIVAGPDGTKPQKNVMVIRGRKAGRDPLKLLKYYNVNAYMLQRDAVRNFLRRERLLRAPMTIDADSLDAPLQEDARSTLYATVSAEVLVPADQASADELELRAREAAVEWMRKADDRWNLILLAVCLALPLTTQPVLQRVFQVRSSQMQVHADRAKEALYAFCRDKLPDSPEEELYLFAREVMKALMPLLTEWGKTHPDARNLLNETTESQT